MNKQVLDVGNCDADHEAITALLQSNFQVEVTRAHDKADALLALERQPFDLVVVNRLMDRDGSEGLSVIQAVKRDGRWQHLPVMMITNLPEHQARAIEAGAVPGFGKASLHAPATIDTLRPFLQ
jgi:CheY-like chemotaxis protein